MAMLKIRLQRTGKRGQAYFRLVVLEHTTKPKGKYLEFLGSYDPHKNELSVNAERVKHWLSMGARLSETANNLLVGKGVIEGEKVKVWKLKPQKRRMGPEAEGKLKEGGNLPAPTAPSGPASGEIVEEQKISEIQSSEEAAPEEVKTEEAVPAAT